MDDYVLLTPSELEEAYSSGRIVGALPDFEADTEMQRISADISFLSGSGEGKKALLYRSTLKYDAGAYTEKQTTGDCVSHYVRNACQCTASVEIDLKGEYEEIPARFATEPIYGYRGHSGQGANCSRLLQFVNSAGGILVRKNYPELGVDLSTYNSRIGSNWGGRGVPSNIVEEAKKHQIKEIHRVSSIEEARDLMVNGYAGGGCSGYGFSSRRDSNGIASRSGSWSHAMAWLGVDDTRERLNEMLFLVQNSWGAWNSGPKWPEDQPDGSFWIRQRDAEGMIRSGGFAHVAMFDGFKARKIPDYILI